MSKKKKKSFNDFVTRPKSNAGVEVIIPGTDGETLTILGGDSDAFKKENHAIFTELSKVDITDEKPSTDEIEKRADANHIRICSALVAGWSFAEDCTRENVTQFLKDAPYVADLINMEADKVNNFMGKP